MKFVIGMIKHETNTFSPILTTLKQFQEWGLFYGEEVTAAYANTAMPIASYLQVAHQIGAIVVTPIAAEAMPSGIVSKDAYEHLCNKICAAVATGCDAILLDLHGAMVTENVSDAEGELLEKVRKLAPNVPIGVTCDFHGNITERMIKNCTVLMGYKTYPHVDMGAIGTQVATLIVRTLRGEISPVMVWGNKPLLAQTLRMATDDEPMYALISASKLAEKGSILGVTVFGGFPLADFYDSGLSAVIVSDGDEQTAIRTRDYLLNKAWEKREDFVYQITSLSESLTTAKNLSEWPILLLDHADNCGSGGTQDVMTVIYEVIKQGFENVAMAAIYDPEAVSSMVKAGIGAKISLALGGKTDMPEIGLLGKPLVVSGIVQSITDGKWTIQGDMYHGQKVNTGQTAVIDIGKISIIVVSRRHEPWDTGIFTNNGIDPRQKKYIILKCRIHHRAAFNKIIKRTILCDGEGVTTSNNKLLNYKNIRHPIYPLDRL